MKNLSGNEIYLRALELSDLDILYKLENDERLWEVSNTITPYSKFVLKHYLDNSHRDIYEVKQLRLVLCKIENDETVGFVDLFDFDPKHKKTGIGIVIYSENERRKGFAFEALQLVCKYAFKFLNVHQVYANITEDNTASRQLFEKGGFKNTTVKKDWIFSAEGYKNECLYQLINE